MITMVVWFLAWGVAVWGMLKLAYGVHDRSTEVLICGTCLRPCDGTPDGCRCAFVPLGAQESDETDIATE